MQDALKDLPVAASPACGHITSTLRATQCPRSAVPSAYLLVNFCFPSLCQERPAETNANVDDSALPSVAQLAGRFREQAAAAKEVSQAASEPLSWEGAGGRGSLGQAQRRGREEAW